MQRRRLPLAEKSSEPIGNRIATGLHKIGLALKQHSWAKANEDGLSPTQGQILAALAEGPLTASTLSQRLGVTLPTISDSVRALVLKSLVTKTPDARHPRASLLTLTAAGQQQAERARAWPEFLASTVGVLSDEEQTTFLKGLSKMIRTLQETGQVPLARMCVTCTHFRPNVHDGPTPHHCAFIDVPLADRDLRLDCTDYEEASADAREDVWQRFLRAG